MKVIVCGAGRVGAQIARRLSQEGNEVTVIDQDPALVKRLSDADDVAGVVGHASHPDVLERAGAADAEMLIAATQMDEINMVACQVAHSVFSVPRKIARVRAQAYREDRWSDLFRREHMPIDVVISPEAEVARVALARLASTAAFESHGFLEGRAQLVALHLDSACAVLNTPLRQLTELFSTLQAIVVAVRRGDKLIVPEPTDQLYLGDDIYIVAASHDVQRAMGIFGRESPPARRVVIVGAGNVGLTVARALESDPLGVRVKMIERNQSRAEFAAERLSRTVVLNGDALDPALLDEAGVGEADAILSLTDDDKTNLLACALGKQSGCGLAIALTNDAVFSGLTGALGVDAYINPRATTVSTILRHVRRGRIRSVYSIGEGEGEAIEAQVLATSPIAGRRLREAGFPSGSIVGAVLSGGALRMPRGDMPIAEGDVLVAFCLRDQVPKVEQLFRVSVDYF
ncbi:MAG: Trk system potassium transporter TrkA [Rubrimonas sp.]|uniref:Trk system potassium transporter TrkA n=1 Tax=Rubrimonas sp. TaxID=2036015 RepID=UPI002FDC7F02